MCQRSEDSGDGHQGTEEGKGCIANRVADDKAELDSKYCRCFETTDSRKCNMLFSSSEVKKVGREGLKVRVLHGVSGPYYGTWMLCDEASRPG